MRPGLSLLSVIAFFCLSLEVEVLQQIDGLRLYLKLREIALEAGIALLLTLAIACAWWLVARLLGLIAGIFLKKEPMRINLQWALWIGVPLVYLLVELFRDFNLGFLPGWRPSPSHEVLSGLGVLVICIVGFSRIGLPALQRFCSTRLVAIAWVHIALAMVAALALVMHGVRLFRDYEHPARAAVVSTSPDIYLITIDALRAEDTSVYGYSRATTPNLEKFAQRSFVFDDYFANANFTNPASSSIETGKVPWSHRIFQQGGFLRGENQKENLAAELRQRGYYTAMITSNFFAAPFRHRTLDSYDAVMYPSPLGLTGFRLRMSNLLHVNTQATLSLSLIRGLSSLGQYVDRLLWPGVYAWPAGPVFSKATDLIQRNGVSQPLFLWTHIYPPHDPYWVPPGYQHRFVPAGVRNYTHMVTETNKQGAGVPVEQLRAAYDEMILYADHCVGDFLDYLDRTGRLDRSIVIVSADHGEYFEHNQLAHGGPDLYNSVIHVPLMIHLPGQTQGARLSQLAQQADLLPTVLDLISAPIPAWTDGSSLKPVLENKSMPARFVFTMNLETNRIFNPITKGTVAVMDDDFKFVRYLNSGKELLFRYKTDPGELQNLVAVEPQVAQRMRGVLMNDIQEINRKPIRLQ